MPHGLVGSKALGLMVGQEIMMFIGTKRVIVSRLCPALGIDLGTPARFIPKARLLLLLSAPLATACGNSAPVAGDPNVFCVGDEWNERNVVVEGVLELPSSFLSSNGLVRLRLRTQSRAITLGVYEGDGPNHMAPLPPQYTDSDLVLHTANGTAVGVGSRIRVTGEVTLPGHPSCGLIVQSADGHKIEALH